MVQQKTEYNNWVSMNSAGGSLDANILRRHYALITSLAIIAMSSPAALDAHSTSTKVWYIILQSRGTNIRRYFGAGSGLRESAY